MSKLGEGFSQPSERKCLVEVHNNSPGSLVTDLEDYKTPRGSIRGCGKKLMKTGSGKMRTWKLSGPAGDECSGSDEDEEQPPHSRKWLDYPCPSRYAGIQVDTSKPRPSVPLVGKVLENLVNMPDSGSEEELEEGLDFGVDDSGSDVWDERRWSSKLSALKKLENEWMLESGLTLDDESNDSASQPAPPPVVDVQVKGLDEGGVIKSESTLDDESNDSASQPAPPPVMDVQVKGLDEGGVIKSESTLDDESNDSASQPAPPPVVDVQVKGLDEGGVTAQEIVEEQMVGFEWQSDFSLFEGQRETYLREPGPTIPSTCPYELFSAVWDKDIMSSIVRQTNLYACQTIASLSARVQGLPSTSRMDRWKDTDIDEMYVFLSILMYMTLCYRSQVDEFWTTGFMEMLKFRTLMSRDRFFLLLKFLHFVDNSSFSTNMTSYEKKVHKVAGVIDHCNKKFAELYVPKQFLRLDESLLLWKGRLSWVQCIRTKAARCGIKSFELCEGDTGYLLRTVLYAGKDSVSTENTVHGFQNTTAKVVLKLMDGYLDVGHVLVMDSWYNQMQLTRYLKSRHTDVVGTQSRRSVNVPEDIRSLDEQRMPRGNIVARHCKDISVIAWKDDKLVTMASTYHTDETFVSQQAGVAVVKPVVVRDYNAYMGGVGLKDQRISMYTMERKRATKWYLKVFRRMVNTSLLNTYLMYQANMSRPNQLQPGRILTHRQFRYAVADLLIQKHRRALPSPAVEQRALDTQPHRLDGGQHFPVQTQRSAHGSQRLRQRRCVRCSAAGVARYVSTMCERCNVGLCLGLCYKEYHTLVNLKAPYSPTSQ